MLPLFYQAEAGLQNHIIRMVTQKYLSNHDQKRKKFEASSSLICDVFNFFKAKIQMQIFFSFDSSSPASEAKIKKKSAKKNSGFWEIITFIPCPTVSPIT